MIRPSCRRMGYTGYRTNPDPARLLPVYRLALGVQPLHFAEEHCAHLDEVFPRLLARPAYPHDTVVTVDRGASCLFLPGATARDKGTKPPLRIALFFIRSGVVGNALGRLNFAVAGAGTFRVCGRRCRTDCPVRSAYARFAQCPARA